MKYRATVSRLIVWTELRTWFGSSSEVFSSERPRVLRRHVYTKVAMCTPIPSPTPVQEWQCPVSCCRAFDCSWLSACCFCVSRFLSTAVWGFCSPPGVPFVLKFWWSCPFCFVFLPPGGCGWHGSFVAGHRCWCLFVDAQSLLHAGVFFFLSVVVVGGCLLALWGFCPPGVFVFFP